MNHLGWLAEELTYMEETLEDARYAPYAEALRRALQRAYVEACKASREMRHAHEEAERTETKPAKQPKARAKRLLIPAIARAR